MSDPRIEQVRVGELPPELMDAATMYSVTLVGVRREIECTHFGSGTFVKTGGRHFILTANHCAKPLFEYERFGLPIRFGDMPLMIEKIPPIYIGSRTSDEWGPDLAFIPLDPVDVSTIHASSNKTFYNLDKYQEEMLARESPIDNHLWAVVGSPFDECNFENPPQYEFMRRTITLNVERARTRDGLDYLEVKVPTDGISSTFFKGISGGGLWHADVHRDDNGTYRLFYTPRLEGVAFYRTNPEGDIIRIRFHGRRSIYEYALGFLRSQLAE
jgi:hypothetical protein